MEIETLKKVDPEARDAIWQINQIPGLCNTECCAGHIQEGQSNNEIERYIPGLVIIPESYEVIDGCAVTHPKEYLHFGNPINIDDFIQPAFTHRDNILVYPLSELKHHPHTDLQFTGSYLTANESSGDNPKKQQVRKSIEELSKRF
ncbi:MAG: hypothetical protein ABIH58_06440 [Patescibacteria group bacterium]